MTTEAVAAEAPILLRRDGGVAVLTLNRPQAANSIDAPLARAFRDAMAGLAGDKSVRALLLQGVGRMFCAGGDLASFAREGGGAARYVEALIADLHAGLEQLFDFHAPVVAAVHGAAAGAGLGLALAADIVVAGEGARFVMAYTRSGLTPDGGTSWALPRVVGLRRALELTFLNPTLSAAEALREGLITEVVDDKAVAGRAANLAQELAAGPTGAYAAARRLMRESIRPEYAAHLRREAEGIVAAFSSPDGLEGVRAFQERRPPVFHGA
ncbi:enoyl-CoA hydratase-related protein [Phenylobacterium sp.]|uniref:enoyl-CoA hydratase/isomerase family protein n=1 Tax=Phenylobacterium sp. TaxID=1871053 RepID=UPI0025F46B4C|nr:enoyl-CoA hydratase-related protein [Phenylobacterium sp.]